MEAWSDLLHSTKVFWCASAQPAQELVQWHLGVMKNSTHKPFQLTLQCAAHHPASGLRGNPRESLGLSPLHDWVLEML